MLHSIVQAVKIDMVKVHFLQGNKSMKHAIKNIQYDVKQKSAASLFVTAEAIQQLLAKAEPGQAKSTPVLPSHKRAVSPIFP